MNRVLAVLAVAALTACSGPVPAPVPPQTTAFDGAVRIPSGGETLTGTLYVADGVGPHPTLVWFHGFPGLDEPTHDAVAVFRDASLNVLYFHYRGSWGEGGEFSAGHALEDAAAALAFLRDPEHARRYRVDPDAIIAFGDSFGSWVALETAAANPAVRCAAGALVLDLGLLGEVVAADDGAREAFGGMFAAIDADPAIGYALRGGAAGLLEELVETRGRNDLLRLAERLADRPVLLIGAADDELAPPEANLVPIARAIEAAGVGSVESVVLPGGHELRDADYAPHLAAWVRENCANDNHDK